MWRLNRFLQLNWKDRWLLLKVTFLVSLVWLGLRLFPFRVMRRWLERAGDRTPGSPLDESEADRISSIVDKAGRNFLGKDLCFPQALLGEMLLRRGGFNPQLRIGVFKENSTQLKAHAWVELDGRAIIGGPQSLIEKYMPLPNLDDIKL